MTVCTITQNVIIIMYIKEIKKAFVIQKERLSFLQNMMNMEFGAILTLVVIFIK